ncbi:MAG: homoserine dehydrogenase, partial [Alistipes sp.]|nr:homoserine dehydrogenase [Alistipes sp.]
MNSKKLNIGLFGFGTVGSGLYDVLKRIDSKNVEIKRVCVRNISKPRKADVAFTDNADDIFNDPEINFIVELIDDADAA